jgi:hypothetical protein
MVIEDALKRRAAMRAPADFTGRVLLRAAEGIAAERLAAEGAGAEGLLDRRATWISPLNAAATVLIVLGLGWSREPARLADLLDGGLNLLQDGGTALGMVAGVNPPAPLVLAALAVWVAGLLVSTWTELFD